jgi:hypothetical protein
MSLRNGRAELRADFRTQAPSARDRSIAMAETLVRQLIAELARPGYFGSRVIELKSQDGVITTARIQSEDIHKLV